MMLREDEDNLLEVRAAEWGILPTEYAKLQMLAPAADCVEVSEDHLRAGSSDMAKQIQINVRLHDDEYDLLQKRAAEWGISPPQYAKLQMLAPAADWGMRRAVMTEAALRAPSANVDRDVAAIMQSDGYELKACGWWKQRDNNQWLRVDG